MLVRCPACRVEYRRRQQHQNLRSFNGRWHVGRLGAGYRGITWDLTREEYADLIGKPCIYCGNPLNASGSGLDRLDSEGPYVLSNVVPSCWPCNYIKRRGAFSFDEMMRLGPTLGPIWQVHPPRGTKHQMGTLGVSP
jgi:hypothetical protein